MIVPMRKAYVVARRRDRDRLLEALGELGVVHVTPIDPAKAVPGEETRAAIDRLRRARQVLGSIDPAGEKPALDPEAAAAEAMDIHRRAAERRSRLAALHRQIEQIAMWGDLRIDQLDALQESGLDVRFYAVPPDQADAVKADFVEPVGEPTADQQVLAVVRREGAGEPELPEDFEQIEPPQRDRPTLRAEAAEIDAEIRADEQRLDALAHLAKDIETALARRRDEEKFAVAAGSGTAEGDLYAVQGWVPQDMAEHLARGLAEAEVDAGVTTFEPDEADQPPTLVRYPKWSLPIKGLFDLLGTVPGYREVDVSAFFMIALPIFAAMLIGDAGYGLLFVVVPAIWYRKMARAAGAPGTQLLIAMGAATVVWGGMTGVFFGLTPQDFLAAGAMWEPLGRAFAFVQIIGGDVQQQAATIMKISFIMAAVHLSLAQIRQALAYAPNLVMLSKVGWATFLWGIFFVIWYLFFDSQAGRPPHWLTGWLLAIGAALIILFTAPSRNPLKMVGLGLAQFPLDALGSFSDSISYIRLMGVGLASTIIGQTFNELGANVASGATWIAGAPVVVVGHGLNIAMCMIAILAHGVRLNMLEFSNNVGVQWAGYAYEPFAVGHRKEQ